VVAGRLSLGRLSPPPGDESLGFSGSATLPVPFDPPLDPVHNGVRIVVDDPSLAVVVDETVPGVAYDAGTRQGWTASASGWRWRSHTGPITKVGIKTSPKVPGGLRFSVKGRNGTWAATPAELPLRATLVLDPPDAPGGQCAATAFGGTSCAFTGSGTTLRCR
jgi:hypothetical protein